MLRAEQVLKGQAWWALGEFPCSSRGAALCPSDNQGVCAAEGSAQLSAPAQHRRRCPSCHRAVSSGTSPAAGTLCTGNKPELSSPELGQLYQPPLWFCASQPHCNYSSLPMHRSAEQPRNKEGGKYLLSGIFPAPLLVGTFIPVMGTSWIQQLQE